MGHGGGVDKEFVEAWRSALGEMIYLPSQQRYGRIASATNSDKVESLQVGPPGRFRLSTPLAVLVDSSESSCDMKGIDNQVALVSESPSIKRCTARDHLQTMHSTRPFATIPHAPVAPGRVCL